eukprot:Nitzschia sp. Nitz4//scaffold83_size84149//10078//11404//NITZ4_005164-RA/size84149-processed-gene-0.16-mRNA-1//1//CDS//3329558917//8349//frame0
MLTRDDSARGVLLSPQVTKGMTPVEKEKALKLYEEEADIDYFLLEMELGEGPMRFAGKGEHSISRQLRELSEADYRTFRKVKDRCHTLGTKRHFNDAVVLRFLRNTIPSGKSDFSEDRAWKALKKFNLRYHEMRLARLEKQLLSKTLFPLPGLKSKQGHDMFYMRPSRFVPRETRTKDVIDNLMYVMNSMVEERESACRDGIGFVACMDGWTMKNFEVEYCFQFMMGLQGRLAPVNVTLFLIVNPPSWFGAIWKIMKRMLTASFRQKVKMIPESDLEKYLQPGFEQYLPDDMKSGQVNTMDLVDDFVEYRRYLDEQNGVDDDIIDATVSSDGKSKAFSEDDCLYWENLDSNDASVVSSRSGGTFGSFEFMNGNDETSSICSSEDLEESISALLAGDTSTLHCVQEEE